MGKVCRKNRSAASTRASIFRVPGAASAANRAERLAVRAHQFKFNRCGQEEFPWWVAGEGPRVFRQYKDAARTLLHQVVNPAILGVRDTNKAVSETRFGGFSFF
jgi:hypothetical protein